VKHGDICQSMQFYFLHTFTLLVLSNDWLYWLTLMVYCSVGTHTPQAMRRLLQISEGFGKQFPITFNADYISLLDYFSKCKQPRAHVSHIFNN